MATPNQDSKSRIFGPIKMDFQIHIKEGQIYSLQIQKGKFGIQNSDLGKPCDEQISYFVKKQYNYSK
jgi:hypothetical protein